MHSGHNSGWRAGARNNLGDKELKGKKGQEVGGGCGCKGGGGVRGLDGEQWGQLAQGKRRSVRLKIQSYYREHCLSFRVKICNVIGIIIA